MNVVGHAAQRELLARALARHSVHPALLFCGPPGIGKRLVAAGLAQAWLCLEGGAEPCGRCESCRRPHTNPDADLLTVGPIDNKKSIGVAQVRDLETWLGLMPSRGQRKMAIVDPADALTAEAANALLKTLEEPPRGRVIVLVAERAGSLPPTVRSRCQLISFGPLADAEVAEVLRRNGWPAQAALQAAALAEGSPGLALARDGKAWQEAADAVRQVLEELERGDRGAALAFAERLGEGRERVLLTLQALLGLGRREVRGRLGAPAGDPGAPLLRRLGAQQIAQLLAGALETHRRLDGDRPPNAKLALATLLLGAGAGIDPEGSAPAREARRASGGGR